MSEDRLVRFAIFWILLVGFLVRAQTFKAPLFDHHNWRQADTAQVARNFWRERFNPFFPQVDQRGAQEHGYVETGFELYAFGLAAVARVTGFHVEIGRVMNSLLFVGSGVLVFFVLRRRYDRTVALVGLFVYAFGLPLPLFLDRAVMNEPLLIFLSFVCLASALIYLDGRRCYAAAALVAASALAGAIKFPYLIVWAPVVGLFLERDGRRAFKRWPLVLMVAVDLAAAWLWYSHAHRLGRLTGLTFGMLEKAFDPRLASSPAFYATILQRLGKDVLGPVGLVAAAAGLVLAVQRRRWMEVLGVLAFAAYVVLVAAGTTRTITIRWRSSPSRSCSSPSASATVSGGCLRSTDGVTPRRCR